MWTSLYRQENKLIDAVRALLPLSPLVRGQMDKSCVLRVATAQIQLRRLLMEPLALLRFLASSGSLPLPPPPSSLPASAFHAIGSAVRMLCSLEVMGTGEWSSQSLEESKSSLATDAKFINTFEVLDGFIWILNHQAKIVYVSESACAQLGPRQCDLMGLPVTEMIHPADAVMLESRLAMGFDSRMINVLDPEIHFTLRFDAKLASKRQAGLYIEGYKPIHFTGRVVANNNCRFIGYGHPLTDYRVSSDLYLLSNSFVFRATQELEIVFIDNQVLALTGFQTSTFFNHSFYKFVHPADLGIFLDAHITALRHSQAESGIYRILVYNGGWVWVQTNLTLLLPCISMRSNVPPLFLGITTILSSKEKGDTVLDEIQSQSQSTSHGSEKWGMLGEHSEKFYLRLNSSSTANTTSRESGTSNMPGDDEINKTLKPK